MTTDPKTVLSPRDQIKSLRVVYTCHAWSLAEIDWKGGDGRTRQCLGMRWNGDAQHPKGNPTSRGFPTWFIVPDELEDGIRGTIASITGAQ